MFSLQSSATPPLNLLHSLFPFMTIILFIILPEFLNIKQMQVYILISPPLLYKIWKVSFTVFLCFIFVF